MGTLLFGAAALAGLAIGIAALIIAVLALIEVKAMQRSTHSIEYINPQSVMGPMGGPSDEELEKSAVKAGLVMPSDDLADAELEDL